MADSSFYVDTGADIETTAALVFGIPTAPHFATWENSNTLQDAGPPSGTLLDALTGFASLGVLQRTGAGGYAFLTVGTAANDLVQLDSSARLPAVDGSQLTNLPGGGVTLTGEVTTSGSVATITKSITPTWTGLHTFNAGLTSNGLITANGTGTFPQGLKSTVSLSGSSIPAGNAVWLVDITGDTANVGNAFSIGFNVTQTFGGSATIGGRAGIYSTLILDGATSGSNPNRNYIGAAFTAQALSGDGGTNLTTGALGSIYGFNAIGYATTATNLQAVTGGEINFALQTGTSSRYKTGLQIIQHISDVVVGSALDASLLISSQSTLGLNYGIVFGDTATQQPVKSTGTLIGIANPNGGTTSVAYGVDLRSGVFSGYAFASPSFSIDGSGNGLIGGTLGVSGEVSIGTVTGTMFLASSANTGAGNQVQVANSGTGTTTGTSASFEANVTGLTNGTVQLAAQGGSGSATTTRGVLLSGAGLTSGWLIQSNAGPVVLNTATTLQFQSGGTGIGDYGLTAGGAWTFRANVITQSTFQVANVFMGSPVTFASLAGPSAASGYIFRLSDGTSGLAMGANVTTGGGSTPYLIWSNGTNWTVIGK
jgi:trimeric autotransporter adhesin